MKSRLSLALFAVFTFMAIGTLTAAVPVEGFGDVVDKVAPSVVGITVIKTTYASNPFNYNFDFNEEELPEELRKFFQQWDFGTPEVNPEPKSIPGVGTGVIFDTQGHIITNNHVVEGADEIMVKLDDGTEYSGNQVEVVGTDPETDLAVIKIRNTAGGSKAITPAQFANSDEIKVGNWAIAIGNPYNLEHTVTVGVISAKGRSNVALYGGPVYQNFLQTDASINPGNSGGPLCNINGEIIGINTAIRTNGLSNSGIGFAIPSSLVSEVAAEIIKNGKVSRGYIGVYLEEASDDVLQAMKIDQKGVFVTKVIADTPADKAGFAEGDLITRFNNQEVTDVDQLRWLAASTKPGTKVDVVVVRDGKTKNISLKLEERPAQEEMAEQSEIKIQEDKEETFVLGVTARDLTDEEKGAYSVDSGVYIQSVKSGSLAAKAGIQSGDILQKVNKNTVSNVKELKRLKGSLEQSEVLLFQINRRGHTHFLTIRP